MDKVKLVFTDTPSGVKGFCPKCQSFSLEPTEFYGAPFVKCGACGFESPASIFEIRHERAHGDRALPPLQRLNGKQATTPQAHNGTAPQAKLLSTKSLSDWLNEAKALPPITPLFDAFWQCGELAFLFGTTNVGKTIIAVQIADAISRGAKIQGFDGAQTPMKVCLFDFELSARQFLMRYSENDNLHEFSPNLLRTEINADAELPKGMRYEDYILKEIETTIVENGVRVAVIDNLTALLSNITETKDSLELMRKLRVLKMKHDLSMLILSHTPKRDASRPISKTDMVGSMHLLNLADSVFCVGESAKENDVRYLKQLKSRSAEFKYDAENVATFRIVKNGSYLCFEHIGFEDEKEHLRARTDAELDELEMNIIALHESEPSLSFGEIARRLNTNKMRVSRVLKRLSETPLNTGTPF